MTSIELCLRTSAPQIPVAIINETLEYNQVSPSHQDPIPDSLESCSPPLVSPESEPLSPWKREIPPVDSQSLDSEHQDDKFEAPTSDEHLPYYL